MGVTGLWPLIAPVGKPVTLESLENKTLAVDVSIWLNQAVKGFRDGSGRTNPNAHLLSLCNRICKLLFYRIKPVFVFDGSTPYLKRQTLAAREKQRQKSARNFQRTAKQILTNYLATEAVQGGSKKKSPTKRKNPDSTRADDDIFRLPPAEISLNDVEDDDDEDDYHEETPDTEQDFSRMSADFRLQDLSSVDIESSEFKSLPPDIRFEILSAMKENKRRYHSKPLPEDSQEFSNFQMNRLLERSRLQRGMESAAKELNQRQVGEVMMELCEDGTDFDAVSHTHKIVSEDGALSLLIHKASRPKETPVTDEPKKPSILEDMNEFIFSGSSDDDDGGAKEDVFKDLKETADRPKDIAPLVVATVSNHSQCNNQSPSDDLSTTSIFLPPSQTSIVNPVAQWFVDVEKSTEPERTLTSPSMNQPRDNSSTLNLDSINHSETPETKAILQDYKTVESDVTIEKFKKRVEATASCTQDFKSQAGETVIDKSTTSNLQYQKSEVDVASSEKENKIVDPFTDTSEDHKICAEETLKDKHFEPNQENETEFVEESSFNKNSDISVIENAEKSTSSVVTENAGIPNEEGENSNSKSFTITVDIKSNHKAELDDLFLPEMFMPMTEKSQGIGDNISNLPETSKLSNQIQEVSDEEIEVSLSKEVLNAASQEEALAVLEAEREQLLKERGKHQRHAQTLTEQVVTESQELLRLFGVPYVASPMEAEAQCAALESLKLTQGTITDDSDIWLFGGQRVYRHFFHQDKYVQLYTKDDIQSHFGLDQEKLICFAMLTGSDYTEGVEGVGAVSAMEILAEFKGQGLQTLKSLKSWWEGHQNKKAPPGNAIRGKLVTLRLQSSFPRDEVFQAYLNPEVDKSTEKFSWQAPDLCALRELLNGKLGMRMEKVNDMILPVIKKFNQSQSQTRLDSFFTTSLKAEAVLPPSKRLQQALQKFHPKENQNNVSKDSTKKKGSIARGSRTQKTNCKSTRGRRKRTLQEHRSDSSDCDDPKATEKKGNTNRSILSESSSESSSEAQGIPLVVKKGKKIRK